MLALASMRRASLFFAALVVLATTASCLSPTLPLPPPEQPDFVSQDSTGLWQIAGNCDRGALVTVFDTATGRGVVVEDVARSGTYHVAIAGKVCDTVWVSQQTLEGGESPVTAFVLEEWNQGPIGTSPCQ